MNTQRAITLLNELHGEIDNLLAEVQDAMLPYEEEEGPNDREEELRDGCGGDVGGRTLLARGDRGPSDQHDHQEGMMRNNESHPWNWCSDTELEERIDRTKKRLMTTRSHAKRHWCIERIEALRGELARREDEREYERYLEEHPVANGYADYLEYFYGEDR